MKEKAKRMGVDVLTDLASGLFLTAAIYSFAVPAGFPMTGVSGIAMILYQIFGTPIGTMNVALNIPIALFCYKTLGKRFYLNSLKTILITSAVMDLLGPMFPVYEGEMFLAALGAGVLCGIGYGIVFLRGSSTGGVDFVMMTIRAYHPHLSLGNLSFIIDTTVIAVGSWLLGSMNALICGVVMNYLNAAVLDKVIYGMRNGKLTMIITSVPEKTADMIHEQIGRGTTILRGVGGYTGEKKDVVLCASSHKEMYDIKRKVHSLDENAFVIIVDSNDVIGEGFRLPGDTNIL